MKTIKNKNNPGKSDKPTFIKLLKYGGVIIGSIVLICLLISILFPDYFINTFFKDKIARTLNDAYPAYKIKYNDMHYSIWKNQFVIDSLKINSRDSSISAGASSVSVGGIGWIKTIWNGSLDSSNIKNLELNIEGIAVDFNKDQKVLRLGSLHISVPDSEMVTDSIKYYPSILDQKFFANSNFRQTRFNIDIPKIEITGLDIPALMSGKFYKAGKIDIDNLFADILVNMDKPYDKSSPNPKMPNELFSSINKIIKIDIVKVTNGRLKYAERTAVGAQPGVVTFNKVNILISGIDNTITKPDYTTIDAEGIFMNSGKMKIKMKIPLLSKIFSLNYTGSLTRMDVTTLNKFIEANEHQRIKSGILQSASFNIDVNSGRATGTLRVAYQDLSIAVLNKETGSERGIFNRILSFIGKVFVIRGDNMPDEKGNMKIGEIKYSRYPADYFLQFVWFALRSGVGDVVGFPPEAAAGN